MDDSDSGRPVNPHDRFFCHALVKPVIAQGFFRRYPDFRNSAPKKI